MSKKPQDPVDPPVPVQTFGQHLRQLRERANLTIAQVSVASGVAPENWAAMESDQANPRLSIIRPMATALGVAVPEVF